MASETHISINDPDPALECKVKAAVSVAIPVTVTQHKCYWEVTTADREPIVATGATLADATRSLQKIFAARAKSLGAELNI